MDDDREAASAPRHCQQAGVLARILGCAAPRPRRRKVGAARGDATPEEDGTSDGKDADRSSIRAVRARAVQSVANVASSAMAVRNSVGRATSRLSVAGMSSLWQKEDEQFCRSCGTRLSSKGDCFACAGDDDDSAQDGVVRPRRLSAGRQRRARRATLSKYMAVVEKQGARVRNKTMDAAFRERLQRNRKDFMKGETTRRLKRAQSLRDDFLSDASRERIVAGELGKDSQRPVVFEECRPDKARPRSESTRSEVELEVVRMPGSEEEEYNRDVDAFLAESLRELEANKLAEMEGRPEMTQKEEHLEKIRRIKTMRHALLTEQDEVIASLWSESKAVIKGLRKHVRELTATLKKKAKEGDVDMALDREEEIANLDAVLTAYGASANRPRASMDEASDVFDAVLERERERRKRASLLLQESFENSFERLQQELATTVRHLNELEIERYFPKCMQWKVRLNSGDGLYIGMRDLDLEMLDGNVVLGRGDELGTVLMKVSDIRAIVGIYQFSINGSTATAKLLRGLLTPTVNRLDLEVSGEWTLKLRYKAGSSEKDLRPKWVKEKSTFNLHLTKETAGMGLLRLPDRVIRWLTTQLLPSVISSSIMLNLPVRLGMFFQHPQNYVRLQGKLIMKGDIPPRVWCAPLVGPTWSAKMARKAMGISDEEAVLLDLMFRSDLATFAGFHKKALSMARLYKWRLQYASQPTSRLAGMLSLIENNPHVLLQDGQGEAGEVSPRGWALQVLDRVCELAVKPVSFDLQVTEVDADINVKQALDIAGGMYLESLEHEVEKASGVRATRVAQKKVDDAKERVAQFKGYVERYIAPLLSNEVSSDLAVFAMGGLSSGIIMASLENFAAQLRMPRSFEWTEMWGEAVELSKGFDLTLSGTEGPGQGEYTLKAKHKWIDPREAAFPLGSVPEDDALAIVRDLQLNLFPANEASGTVRLTAESLRASLFMCSLGEMTLGAAGDGQSSGARPTAQSEALAGATTGGPEPPVGEESSVEELLTRSRTIVSDLWARYYSSRAVMRSEQTEQGGGGAAPAAPDLARSLSQQSEPLGSARSRAGSGAKRPSATLEHPVLPKMLTDERYDMQIDLRHVHVQAVREIGVDQKETVRVTLRKSANEVMRPGECIAAFHVRFSLAEAFEDSEYGEQ